MPTCYECGKPDPDIGICAFCAALEANRPPGQREDQQPMIHYLKTEPIHFQAVLDGSKTVELRIDDRNFEVGDTLILLEHIYNSQGESHYSGAICVRMITHILRDPDERWLQPGVVALSVRKGEDTDV